jgi:hypothetical protein
MGVVLGASSSQVMSAIHNIKEVDNKRNLIMIQKNLNEANKLDDSSSNEVLDQASSLSRDIVDDSEHILEGMENTKNVKNLKVYTRRKKAVPAIVRRSVRLSKKSKQSD